MSDLRTMEAIAQLADGLTDSLSGDEWSLAVAIKDLAKGSASVDDVAERLGEEWEDL